MIFVPIISINAATIAASSATVAANAATTSMLANRSRPQRRNGGAATSRRPRHGQDVGRPLPDDAIVEIMARREAVRSIEIDPANPIPHRRGIDPRLDRVADDIESMRSRHPTSPPPERVQPAIVVESSAWTGDQTQELGERFDRLKQALSRLLPKR